MATAVVEDPVVARPNIRIEIKNNVTEEMDVDLDENEDGEILDDDDQPVSESIPKLQWKETTQQNASPQKGVFTTGIDIFDRQAQRKLEERARRFALKPEEIHSFTDADLLALYDSLGITNDDTERVTRFDTVHVYGVSNLSTEVVLDYFAKYAPTHIELIDEDSCNMRWFENITAARAMFYNSKAVNGMPVREQINPLAKEFVDDTDGDAEQNTGQSILFKNRNIALNIRDILPNKQFQNAVDISDITIPIPPGYWRLGRKHPKAKCLLLRYAFKTDKKPFEVKDLTRYYRKLGSGGVIRQLEDAQGVGGSLFERNRDLPKAVSKNPWGELARDWNRDKKFCEPVPDNALEEIEITNPRLLLRLGKRRVAEHRADNHHLHEEGEMSEEDKLDESRDSRRSSGNSRQPMPRMRMYADEEEEQQRRRRALQKLKKTTEELTAKENQDLRNVLRHPAEFIGLAKEADMAETASDLGAKLRNRARKMVFTLHGEQQHRDEGLQTVGERDARRILIAHRKHASSQKERGRQRSRSPYVIRDQSEERYGSSRRRSPIQGRSKNIRHLSVLGRGRLHSDLMVEEHKPKSKVAVVIKKPKQPAVASTIWSKVKRVVASDDSESSSEEEESGSQDGESTSSSDEEGSESASENGSVSSEDSSLGSHRPRKRDRGGERDRPGFSGNSVRSRMREAPLKITMRNEHYQKK